MVMLVRIHQAFEQNGRGGTVTSGTVAIFERDANGATEFSQAIRGQSRQDLTTEPNGAEFAAL
jgi:hypothetical protein